MRVYIAVFVLCLIEAIMTSEPRNSASFTKEDSQTQAQSNAISTQAADQNCKPCDNAQQTRANTPKWYTSPEWWLVILGLGTLPVLAWQAFASGNAAAAALKQVNYTAATERAWMMDTKVAPTAGATDRPEGGDQVFIQCVAKNEGRTPARVLGMKALLATGPISDPGKTWDKKMYWFPKTLTPKWTIFPDKSSALHCPVQGLKGQPGQILR